MLTCLLDVDMSRGVVYIATGEKYIVEAVYSAASVKAIHPDLPITLFTDSKTKHDNFDTILPTGPPQPAYFNKTGIHGATNL